jgi:predicted aspartyl protease
MQDRPEFSNEFVIDPGFTVSLRLPPEVIESTDTNEKRCKISGHDFTRNTKLSIEWHLKSLC